MPEDRLPPPKLTLQIGPYEERYPYFTLTLAEALAHLRSTRGSQLIIREPQVHYMSPDGFVPSAKRYSGLCRLIIERTDDGFFIRELGSRPSDDDTWTYDYSRGPSIELVGHMRQEIVDLDIDRPAVYERPT
ncbi:MAG TPA: hypothetical protein VFA63_12570 [Pseudonocardiaceae bacterium]|nr:hypothetical protein [Pseudonocardiaceae bacterium]